MQAGEQLGLEHVRNAGSEAIAEANRFVDPDLRRMTQTLDDLDLPPRLHELTAQAWAELNRLADPGGDTPDVHANLDQLREAYTELYAESEAISRSSVVAAEQRARKQSKPVPRPAPPPAPSRRGPDPAPAPRAGPGHAPPQAARAARPRPLLTGSAVLGRSRAGRLTQDWTGA